MPTSTIPGPVAAAGVTALRDLDVRPILARGGEPFPIIVKTASALGPEEALHLIVGFEPVPLYSVLGAAGFASHTEQTPDAYHVYFFRKAWAEPRTAEAADEPAPLLPPVDLDVRGLEPPQPLATIIAKLVELGPGAQLRVRHRREPLLLYDRLAPLGFAARAERQPEGDFVIHIAPAWFVDTGITEQSAIGEIAARYPETIEVFESHKIDYCCGGGATIAGACAGGKAGVGAAELVRELASAIARKKKASRESASESELSTPALIARIVDRHHGYLRKAAPEIVRLAQKVAEVHRERDPRLPALARRVEALFEKIERHLDREEQVLFPALLARGARAAAAGEGSEQVERELAAMLDDHEDVGAGLAEIRTLAGDYRAPEWACPTYRALLDRLAELEGDVHRHVHLENNVLMPRFVRGPDTKTEPGAGGADAPRGGGAP